MLPQMTTAAYQSC